MTNEEKKSLLVFAEAYQAKHGITLKTKTMLAYTELSINTLFEYKKNKKPLDRLGKYFTFDTTGLTINQIKDRIPQLTKSQIYHYLHHHNLPFKRVK
jgi:hypothetical protein